MCEGAICVAPQSRVTEVGLLCKMPPASPVDIDINLKGDRLRTAPAARIK